MNSDPTNWSKPRRVHLEALKRQRQATESACNASSIAFLMLPLLGLFILLLNAPCWAAACYVSLDGRNANPGTSAAPFRTISKAARVAEPDSIIHVAPGTYPEILETSASGRRSARIRYVSTVPRGAKIHTKGSRSHWSWRNWGSYVDIDGFEMSGNGAGGIINLGRNVRIVDNHMHHIPAMGCTSNGGAGILASNYSSVNVTIARNLVHDIGQGRCQCVHGIYHSHEGGRIVNNIVHRVSGYGIVLWHAPADHIIVVNNFVYDDPGVGIQEGGITGTHNRYVANLDSWNGQKWSLRKGRTHAATVAGEPGFAPYRPDESGDYRLMPSSPAVDRGTSTAAPPIDYDGVPRPQGAGVDVGPFEFRACAPCS